MTTTLVRALRPDDLAPVTQLFEASGELSLYAESVLQDPGLTAWVAVDGGRIVAAVLTRAMHADDGVERGGVEELLVAASHRKRRIGRRLMEIAEENYRQSGAGGMQLAVTETNEAAVRLYKSLGYAVVKRYIRRGRTDQSPSRPENRLRMWKDF